MSLWNWPRKENRKNQCEEKNEEKELHRYWWEDKQKRTAPTACSLASIPGSKNGKRGIEGIIIIGIVGGRYDREGTNSQ